MKIENIDMEKALKYATWKKTDNKLYFDTECFGILHISHFEDVYEKMKYFKDLKEDNIECWHLLHNILDIQSDPSLLDPEDCPSGIVDDEYLEADAEIKRIKDSKIYIDLDTTELHIESKADEDLMDQLVDLEISYITPIENRLEFKRVADDEVDIWLKGDRFGTFKFRWEDDVWNDDDEDDEDRDENSKKIWVLFPSDEFNDPNGPDDYFEDLEESEEHLTIQLAAAEEEERFYILL